jgi:hypothetical protein
VNAAMHLHRADELLQIAGTTFLGLLSKIASLRNHIVSTNSLQLILSAMRTFRTDIEYLRAALKTIYRMAFSTAAREMFADVPNLLERIFESMQVRCFLEYGFGFGFDFGFGFLRPFLVLTI